MQKVKVVRLVLFDTTERKMRIDVKIWTVEELLKIKDNINEQPVYQRGEVWSPTKRKHLIDSLLRGIDIPKIYLRKLNGSAFEYEVADGQQRLTTIIKYVNDEFKLDKKIVNGLNLSQVNGHLVGGKKFTELPDDLKNAIRDYKLTITIVEEATGNEIRNLFSRLQLGSTLNPAEKRNAIVSAIGDHINTFALNHTFFLESNIPASRYNRQNFLAHAVALMKYGEAIDIKAYVLEKLYVDQSTNLDSNDLKNIDAVLDQLHKLDHVSSFRLVNKFTFIDFFLFFYHNLTRLACVDYIGIANAISSFEEDRLRLQRNEPEQLLLKPNPSQYDINLFRYIDAFNKSGSEQTKLATRSQIFNEIFSQFLN